MAAPIYKLWMARTTEAWYQLSSEEQNSLLQKVQDTLVQVGGKSTVTCDSSWSSEQWVFFGVEEYPDLEAVQKHAALLVQLNWFRYMDSMTLLGTNIQM